MATRYSSTFGFLSLSAQPVPRGLVNDFVGWLVSSLNASAGRPKASGGTRSRHTDSGGVVAVAGAAHGVHRLEVDAGDPVGLVQRDAASRSRTVLLADFSVRQPAPFRPVGTGKRMAMRCQCATLRRRYRSPATTLRPNPGA